MDEDLKVYHNLKILEGSEDTKKIKYIILIILNRPVIKEQLLHLNKISDFIICADGGANWLFDTEGKE